ncbi:hypothetical protein BDR05DRAFT_944936 [Suillus weaverae]|nr:hypothetical protein BDR05DRAFT_944936 [Suillus weaverae]
MSFIPETEIIPVYGDPTHVISPVDTEIVAVPGPLLTFIYDTSDDRIEPANCELNDGEINFTDFLHFLDGYSAETWEQDKISGSSGWYSFKDLLSIDAGSNLMQGVTDRYLSSNEVELDVLEGAGITLELNTGDMNACITTESSSKDTNVHGTDITPEPSAGDVDYDVLIHASCHADEPDQIVDGQYRSSDFTLIDNVAGDVAPPLKYQNNTVEGTECYISQMIIIKSKLTANEQVDLCMWLRIWTKHEDHSFSYTLQEFIISKNRKSVIHISPALQAAFDVKGDHHPIMDIYEIAVAYVHKQILSNKDIIAINVEVYQTQAEKHQVVDKLQNLQEAHSHELLAEKQYCQAVEAQLTSLTQQLENAYNI